MEQRTNDRSDKPNAPAPEQQTRSKPLGSEALLGIVIAVAGPILGAMWYSMHEQFSRMDARFNDVEQRLTEVVEEINANEAATSQLVNQVVDEAAKKQYENHVELLSKIDDNLRIYDKNVRLEIDRIESAISVVEDISRQRIEKINDRLAKISDLILPANGPE